MSAFSVTTRKSAPTVELRTLSFPLRTIRWEPVGRFVFCRVTNREESSNQVVIASHLLILEDRQTDRQAGRQVGRQAGRQASRQTGRQADKERQRRCVKVRVQELCESRGGRPGLSVLLILTPVSVDVKQH